ncbi:MAG: hypothetical protein ACD_60C00090G0012 [uncultured bacterium]|nr:MAG: hypothetical protein ACD_60C00090G0012 [uncultured bacterium]
MDQSLDSDVLQQFVTIINDIPFNRILGLKLDTIETHGVTMRFAMTNELIGNFMHGILHGGVISAVLDMAGGVAAMVAAIQKRANKNMEELAAILSKAGTVSMHVDYIRPGKGQDFLASAHVLHSGNKISFTRMELHNQENKLIAAGTATYMIG